MSGFYIHEHDSEKIRWNKQALSHPKKMTRCQMPILVLLRLSGLQGTKMDLVHIAPRLNKSVPSSSQAASGDPCTACFQACNVRQACGTP
jgi:hypothetical protein